ncbi:MAG: hypothetical protein GY738_22900, partial [Pseudoalteromonas sp.]|nr:hypothetical protein [Pseudoalteromonas sp.]
GTINQQRQDFQVMQDRLVRLEMAAPPPAAPAVLPPAPPAAVQDPPPAAADPLMQVPQWTDAQLLALRQQRDRAQQMRFHPPNRLGREEFANLFDPDDGDDDDLEGDSGGRVLDNRVYHDGRQLRFRNGQQQYDHRPQDHNDTTPARERPDYGYADRLSKAGSVTTLRPFDPKDKERRTWKRFRSDFENHCELYRLKEEDYTRILPYFLLGFAKDLFHNEADIAGGRDRLVYRTLQAKLSAMFDVVHPESHWVNLFHSRFWNRKAESVDHFVAELSILASKAFPTLLNEL